MTQSPNIVKGSLLGLLAFFCMAVYGVLTKLALQENNSIIWISFFTYLAGAAFLFVGVIPKGLSFLKSQHYPFLVGRALFGCTASFLYTISIHHTPIVNATLLFNSAPIFIPILSMLIWKNKIEKSVWGAVFIGFIGIVFIIDPTSEIFKEFGDLMGLFSGISLAMAYLLMKRLTLTEPGLRIIFYYLGLGMLIQIPLLFFGSPFPPMESIIYAALSGFVLACAQIALVTGYKYAEASQIGIYQYSTIVFVGLIDWLLWNILPTPLEVVGVILVAIAGMIIIYNNRKLKSSVNR